MIRRLVSDLFFFLFFFSNKAVSTESEANEWEEYVMPKDEIHI